MKKKMSSWDYQIELSEDNMKEFETLSNEVYDFFLKDAGDTIFTTQKMRDEYPVIVMTLLNENVMKVKFPTYAVNVNGNSKNGVIDYSDITKILNSYDGIYSVRYSDEKQNNIALPIFLCWKETLEENEKLRDAIMEELQKYGYIVTYSIDIRYKEILIEYTSDDKTSFRITPQ